jgi:16S rRNA (cytidine1402-2'-O)-methyltransferase
VPLAVALAGFPVASFSFLGFLPRTSRERRALLERTAFAGHALVAFESPHRLRAALADLTAVCGERRVAVSRELSKLHEEIFRGTAGEALEHFAEPRGEIVLVVEAAEVGTGTREQEETESLAAFLRGRAAAGDTARDAVAAAVARFGVGRRAAYAEWQRLTG